MLLQVISLISTLKIQFKAWRSISLCRNSAHIFHVPLKTVILSSFAHITMHVFESIPLLVQVWLYMIHYPVIFHITDPSVK